MRKFIIIVLAVFVAVGVFADIHGVKGGLVVCIGAEAMEEVSNHWKTDGYLFQCLETDPVKISNLRKKIRNAGCYGKATVATLNGKQLPYADNLVNLVLVNGELPVAAKEIIRVMVPNGVAVVNGKKVTKPRPLEIDEWTHYLYDSKNNATSHDELVAPPNSLQWDAAPRWTRHHDQMSSISAAVSSGGRIFFIVDEGPRSAVQLPPDWKLVARDAFNGTLLWKKPIPEWHSHIWPAKSGPAQLPRRLVAMGDKVYVTMGIKAPVSVLDAATGKTLKIYKGTELTEELILSDGVVFAQVNASPRDIEPFKLENPRCWTEARRAKEHPEWRWQRGRDIKRIVALKGDSGKVLWKYEDSIAPITLTATEKHVFYHNGEKAVCLDRKNGKKLWESEHTADLETVGTHTSPNLVAYGGVLLFSAKPGTVVSMSVKDGKTLWEDKHGPSGHASSYDLLVADGKVWSNIGSKKKGKTTGKKKKKAAPKELEAAPKKAWTYAGRNPVTGETEMEFPPDSDAFWFHHRCHRGRATDNYLLMSRTGIEYIDVKTGHWMPNHWIRGACVYGIMPANGFTYAPPHSCACYIESKMTGFNAVLKRELSKTIAPNRLVKGKAYGKVSATKVSANDWPTYRGDAMRSGSTKAKVAPSLKQAWSVTPGGKLSSPVIANGTVFVAEVADHSVHAFKASDGSKIWSFTAGGKVDTPPTVHNGMVLFGSTDGWVYSVRESDGELVWRFRAAPQERTIVSYDQLESAWPLHGSVLVEQGSVYCVAGRSMFLDGGLRLLKLDAATGKLLAEQVMDDKLPGSDESFSLHAEMKGLDMPVAMADILSSDGKRLYMRSQAFDLDGHRPEVPVSDSPDQGGEQAHLVCPSGFLDDAWHHRSYWVFGNGYGGGHNGWFRAGRFAPAGRILVFNEDSVYGYGRKPEFYVWSAALEYQLFAAERDVKQEAIDYTLAANEKQESKSEHGHEITFDRTLMRNYPLNEISAIGFKWRNEQPPLLTRAMVLADQTLFIAGPPDVVDEELEVFANPFDPKVLAKEREQVRALNGEKGSILMAVSTRDGKTLSALTMDKMPIFDGMAAADGKLFMTMSDGSLCCFSE